MYAKKIFAWSHFGHSMKRAVTIIMVIVFPIIAFIHPKNTFFFMFHVKGGIIISAKRF